MLRKEKEKLGVLQDLFFSYFIYAKTDRLSDKIAEKNERDREENMMLLLGVEAMTNNTHTHF